jgi:protein-S-isoprenylcysteine O-methyltransferase Ste14
VDDQGKEAYMTKQVKIIFLFVGIVLSCVIVGLGLETVPSNRMGWILIFIGIAYCMGGSIYLAASKVEGAVKAEAGDRSLWLIGPGFLAVFMASPLEYLYLPPLLPRTTAMQVIGLLLVGAALLLRFWTRKALGRMYTGHVQIKTGHQLVQTGPYRFLRHPGYAGFGLLVIGLCVGYSSLIGLLAIAGLLLPGAAYRMGVEEKLLEAEFGESYQAYARRTKRLVPGIW